MSAKAPKRNTPALLTKTSGLPNAESTSLNNRATSAALDMSAPTAIASPPVVGDRLSDAFGALPVGGIVHGHARARSSQGRCNPSAYAFGRARHYRHFIRQSAHKFIILFGRAQTPRA